MTKTIQIGVWDHDAERAARTQLLVESALRKRQMRGAVTVNCEPPQISRTTLHGRFPVLELEGYYWSLIPDCDFTEEQINGLFQKVL